MHESSLKGAMTIFVHGILIASLLAGCCSAQTSTLKVLPWNNHVAALSLTFDDSRAVHLDVVVPELNKRHLRATFFLIVSKTTRLDDWRRVQAQGHEIGNHSVTHEHAADLNKSSEELQVEDAKKFLDSNFNTDIITFAYPYTEVSPGLLYWVKRYDFAARGGRGDGSQVYIKSSVQPDWYNLPSQASYTKYDITTYKSWVDQDIAQNAWTTLQIHGIGDPSTGFEPIPSNTFIEFLNYAKAAEAKGLWIAPFGEVAAYFRAQKIVEAAQPQVINGDRKFTWQVPTPFPHGVVLKIASVNGSSHARLFQAGHELHRNKDGVYAVSFDAKELVVKGQL
jgi:peptidoglycan/xylan/chitin deacetylase (PgdA/CDA1 family)